MAIYFDEPEKASLAADVVGSTRPRMGTPNLFEASMVVEARQGEAGSRDLDRVLANLELEILAFEAGHVAAARQAFRRFGKGRHRAALNFGDCCAYALAKYQGQRFLPDRHQARAITLTPLHPAKRAP